MADLRQIADIQLFALIHEGATTQVYKGYQPSLERTVLVKVLKKHLAEELKERFAEEARNIARVQHPNIVTIFSYGESDSEWYFATEFVEGLTLQDYLKKKPTPELHAFVLMETCRGLGASHKEGVLHKDLKPSNILISHDGQVKITDFGMAQRVHREGQSDSGSEGTLNYFAPEQILNESTTISTDIFALGVTFYEMLFGLHPFHGNDTSELFHSILHDDPFVTKATKDAPRQLRTICEKMMRKQPSERYHNCDEILRQLGEYFHDKSLAVDSSVLATFLEHPGAYHPKRQQDAIPEKPQPLAWRTRRWAYWLPASLAVVASVAIYLNYSDVPETLQDSALGTSHVEKNSSASYSDMDSSLTESSHSGRTATILADERETPASDPDPGRVDDEDEQTQPDPAIPDDAEKYKLTAEPASVKEVASEPGSPASDHARTGEPVGYLDVTCVPWATVYVDDDSITTTPLDEPLVLPARSHNLRLLNPDFPASETRIEIRENETTNIIVRLWESVATLRLEISPWAEVYIDGKYRDTLPPQDHPFILFPGSHSLELRHPALGNWQTMIDARAGKPIDLKLNLQHLLAN